MYFQITFDSKRIASWFRMLLSAILAFGINHLVTKRRKRIIIVWLLRKDLKHDREARRVRLEYIDRMFSNRENEK